MPQLNLTPAVAAEVMSLIDDLGLVFTGLDENPDGLTTKPDYQRS